MEKRPASHTSEPLGESPKLKSETKPLGFFCLNNSGKLAGTWGFSIGGRMGVKCGGRTTNQSIVYSWGASRSYPENRKCQRCRLPLSIYNGKSICNSCWRIENNILISDDAFTAFIEDTILAERAYGNYCKLCRRR